MSNSGTYWERQGRRGTINSLVSTGNEMTQPTTSTSTITTSRPTTDSSIDLPTLGASSRTSSPSSRTGQREVERDNEVTFLEFNTPLGEGVNHQLQDNTTDQEEKELLSMTEEQVEALINKENEEVVKLGTQFTDTSDWTSRFEPAAKASLDRIESLLKVAKITKRTTHINRLYAIKRTLNGNLQNLRSIVTTEKNRMLLHLSPSVMGSSASLAAASAESLVSRGSTLPTGINPLTEHRSEEGEYSHQLEVPTNADRTVTSRPEPKGTISRLNDLEKRMRVVESSASKSHVDRKIEQLSNRTSNLETARANLEGRVVSKTDLDSILQRICQLELINRQTPNLSERVNELQETCAGLIDENLEINRKVQAAENIVDLLRIGQNTHSQQTRPPSTQPLFNRGAPSVQDMLGNTTTSTEIPSYIAGLGTNGPATTQNPPVSLASNTSPINSRTEQGGNLRLASCRIEEIPVSRDLDEAFIHTQNLSHQASGGDLRLAPCRTEPLLDADMSSSANQSNTSKSYTYYADYVKERLQKACQSLCTLLVPEITPCLSKNKVASLHKSTLNVVISERREVEKLMDKYEKFPAGQVDTNALFRAGEIISDARDWCTNLTGRYDQLDCANKPVDSKLFEGLGVFTEDSETSIYEFLKRFDTFMEDMGSKSDRATLLYEQHLDENIKLMTVQLRGDLDKLKEWLLKRFGEPRNMCMNILKSISKGNPPSDVHVTSTLLFHYRSLDAAMKRIAELKHLPGLPLSKLKNHIEGTDFITSIIDLLPIQANKNFFEKLYEKGIDMINIQGPEALEILTYTITSHTRMTEGRAQSSGITAGSKPRPSKPEREPTKKGRFAHANSKDDDNNSKQNAHHFDKSNNSKSDNRSQPQAKPSSPQTKKPTKKDSGNKQQNPKPNNLTFPCCLSGHNHELGECKAFFGFKCRKRMFLAENKCCFTCLKPYSKCRTKCQNDVPDILLCKGCEPESLKINKTPLNVLICPVQDHKNDLDEVKVQNALKKYLKGFDPSVLVNGKTNVNHIMFGAHMNKGCPKCDQKTCSCSPSSKTRKPDPSQETPHINTSTGESVKVAKNKIKEEAENDAFYVMQTLNLSGQDVLTFFDSGANHNMINGELAEDIDLRVVTDKPVHVGVVGGGSVFTSYGTYALSLGPTQAGYYHNLTAQGITTVTEKWPRYHLKEINDEVNSTTQYPFEKLPKYIGGQAAGLLIGMKEAGLQPHLLFQLPCGLGVYESPLMDKFGSRICYGGPHRVFSEANKKAGCFNHVSFHFTKMIDQYRNSLYPCLSQALEPEYDDIYEGIAVPRDSPPCIKIKESNTYSLYVNALDETDLQEMGIPEDSPNRDTEDDCTCGKVFSTVTTMENYPTSRYAFKAKVPLSRKKVYFDQDDMESNNTIRCEDCVRCKKCGQSARTRMISLQEKVEQEAIEASVKIDLNDQKAWVDFPFLRDPIPALKAKHRGSDTNYYQALKVYKDQCKRPEYMRKEFNKVHADLVNRDFMSKLEDLPKEHQAIIKKSGFRHVMPWRIQEKPDSISTPIRMVVDGTMTGLNQLLAKGENRMTKISSIMIRNRCRKKVWTSDVSKLYNQLHLQPEALPFCLFLFKEDLNPQEDPDIYVMTRAWYGISPVGNQAGEALRQLTSILEDSYPEAKRIVESDLYVDDVFTGGHTDEDVENQVSQVKSALGKGGFSLKYIVKSGEKPCEEASSDGESLKILGYKWKPETDLMSPGFEELNFNKKRRGAKKPNAFPVVSPEDVNSVLKEVKISRRIVASKLAEFWDPLGMWEPFKVQFKLDNQHLKGLEWDFALPADLQELWTARFKEMLQIPHFSAPRCVVPENAVDPTKLRLICLADAAEEAGGCCIYSSYECRDGSYSSSLLISRSKLLDQKVPRNELEAVRIMAETALSVKEALKDMITDIIYVTDSTIALCWCNNLQKKLKVYTLFRVAEIRRNILGEVFPAEEVKLPLYHIDGTLNPADLITKRHDITPANIGPGSIWQQGEKWMSLPFSQMPLTTYEDLKVSTAEESEVDTECFPELIMTKSIHAIFPPQDEVRSNKLKVMHSSSTTTNHCKGCIQTQIYTPMDLCYGTPDPWGHCLKCSCSFTLSSFSLKRGGDSLMLVDLIKYGWKKALTITTNIYRFVINSKHAAHKRKEQVFNPQCKLCLSTTEVTSEVEVDKVYNKEATDYIFRKETSRILATHNKKSLEQYILKDDILYYQSRLTEEVKSEELDCQVFFDSYSIKEFLPVVLSDSDVFFSYLVYVHHNLRPHSGVEITMKEISKLMMVIKNPRRVVQSVRESCLTCRSIRRKTAELRMLNHPEARTILAPPFYIAQMDTVFGFKAQVFKNARKTVKVYALIICCLLTGATNILVIEGLETRDVLQGIERHATRHGMPSVLYVDNGTNLIALQHATFSVRDLNCQLLDSYGIQVRVSNAKSHEERGRVEARVRILRKMLVKLGIKTETTLSVLQWENLFSRISNMINDLPIAKCTRSNLTDPGWDIITPNRLILGRNNMRSIEGCISLTKSIGSENLLRKNQAIMTTWYQLFTDRIHHLIPRPNKWTKTDRIEVGDICLFMHHEAPGLGKDHWKLGRVKEIPKSNTIVISFPGKSKKKELPEMNTIERCPRDIVIIHSADDIDLNTREYLNSLFKGE